MHEIYQQLIVFAYGIWCKRWFALATAYIACIVGWGIVAKIPDSFASKARIYVDTDTILTPLMSGIAPNANLRQQIEVMRRTLISRPNLEKVIRRTDMDLRVEEDGLEALLVDLQKAIGIRAEGADLFWVSYESGDGGLSNKENADLAKRVVQNLLTIFVESNLGRSRQDLASARRFIDEQIADYERQLEEAERRRAEFERRNLGFLPGDQNYFEQMRRANGEYAKIERTLAEAKLVRDELARQLSEIPPFVLAPGGMGPNLGGGDGFASDLPQRISSLERQIDALKVRGYTDKHPDVMAVQQQLAAVKGEFEAQKQAYLEQSDEEKEAEGHIRGNRVPNPLYEQIKIRLVEAETAIASLSGRQEQQYAIVKDLESKAKNVPAIEAEMMRLNRDYDIIQQNYNELIKRREQTIIATDLETKSDKIQFRVIDPPSQPTEPSSPNRPMLLTVVLLVGLGSGLGVALVLSQLHSTYMTVQKLRDSVALPVLGAVTSILSEHEKRQRFIETGVFALLFFGLFLAFGGVFLVEALTAKTI